MKVSFQDVSLAFGEKVLFSHFTKTFTFSGVTALMGPSGSGKTTFFRLLCGLQKPDSGAVLGFPKTFTVLFQEDRLLPWVDALTNVALVSDTETAKACLNKVGLSNDMHNFPGNLSDYVGRLKSEGKIALRSPSRASGEKKVSDQKMRRIIAAQKRAEISKIKREIAGIESKISLAESDLAKVELEMSSPDFFKKGAQCASTTEHYNALKSKIDSLYADWEKCASELEMAMLEQEKTDGI